ncbi:NUDIX domain-containing protein [Rhizobium sp. CFBP 8762]|uniref:NUDIX domain-containing protein n=1 Tax=Rhizobium sp. CFBP 8762 TaxID=2775279 RepID=UPI00177D2529|nr:NUDIX domain-containing protein [Rhizobium sp. CFBP 8762]MBD8555183.1 NUDIX domain-containing protein [Rhizobium sp. CFBP 8762]
MNIETPIQKKRTVEIQNTKVLADDWGKLTKYDVRFTRSDGSIQDFTRETYDRGHGATILLYNSEHNTVILTSQWRLPAFVTGHNDDLIETCAGLLDERDAISAIREEAEEETGVTLSNVTKIGEIYMSPGSVTERLHFFIAPYTQSMRTSEGGGVLNEGEDIKVMELRFREALAMIDDGRIIDAKTIILLQHAAIKGLCKLVD